MSILWAHTGAIGCIGLIYIAIIVRPHDLCFHKPNLVE